MLLYTAVKRYGGDANQGMNGKNLFIAETWGLVALMIVANVSFVKKKRSSLRTVSGRGLKGK